jgi:hypothetical protein
MSHGCKFRLCAGLLLLAAAGSPALPQSLAAVQPTAGSIDTSGSGTALGEVVVTAQRLDLIGAATTASEGAVVNDELALTPAFRPGQLLETVPGLDLTVHSGEGNANQYLMRGYNLDHGTDLAIFIADMLKCLDTLRQINPIGDLGVDGFLQLTGVVRHHDVSHERKGARYHTELCQIAAASHRDRAEVNSTL